MGAALCHSTAYFETNSYSCNSTVILSSYWELDPEL